MAYLFCRNLLKRHLQRHIIDGYDEKLTLLKRWRERRDTGDRVSKEELQGDFLQSIFGHLLGYKSKREAPDGQWNMRIEMNKEEKRWATAILGYYSEAREDTQVVIILQAFGTPLDRLKKYVRKEYSTPLIEDLYNTCKFNRCQWVILSNMEEIGLYEVGRGIEDDELFYMEKLENEKEFKRFHSLLCRDHLISETGKSTTALLRERTREYRKSISASFYTLYRDTRIQLIEELKENNKTYNLEILLEKAQKLLNRVIFICFCEDRGLLPGDLLHHTMQRGKESRRSSETAIFHEIKNLFKVIHQGSSYTIPLHNRSLFEPDDILDNLVIRDEFFVSIHKITDYDFKQDLDSKILGHIFEESISDLERVRASIQQNEYNMKSSRRKREGIYYTPSCIVKYIVKNSLGRYLEGICQELGEDKLPDIESASTPQIERTFIDEHLMFYREYEERLKEVRVLDPACGSGAFLFEAFDYLLDEYRWIEAQVSHLLKRERSMGKKRLYYKSILQKNLFGVDLSEESVEITKLSLWLKTACRGEPFIDLEDTIKCGNALVHDPHIAGNKAFQWEEAFPEIMIDGGFDVVIGNPPYVSFGLRDVGKIVDGEEEYLRKRFYSAEYKLSIYSLFIELGILRLKRKGMMGFIIPDSFLLGRYYSKLRELILRECTIIEISLLQRDFWKNGSIGKPVILILKRETSSPHHQLQSRCYKDILAFEEQCYDQLSYPQEEFSHLPYNRFRLFFREEERLLVEKIERDSIYLKELKVSVHTGIRSKIGQGKICSTTYQGPDWRQGLIKGGQVERYIYHYRDDYIRVDPDVLYSGGWDSRIVQNPKLLMRQTGDALIVSYDDLGLYHLNNLHSLSALHSNAHLKYIMAVLNSKLLTYYYRLISLESGRSMAQTDIETIEKLPFKEIVLREQIPFIEVSNEMHYLKKKMTDSKTSLHVILSKYGRNSRKRIKDLQEETSFQRIYSGRARRVRPFTVRINDRSITLYTAGSSHGQYELLSLYVKDDYRRQYIKLILENLTEEELEEINRFRGNILDRVLQIEIPHYDEDQVVHRVVNEWEDQKREISDLQREIEKMEVQIDRMVYKLYGLCGEEIELVEGGFRFFS